MTSLKKPDGLTEEQWDDIINPAPAHRCSDCRFCMPVPEELKAKGKAHSYCTAKMVVTRTSGIKISGRWYELVSAKQTINCKLFEPLKEDKK